MDKKQICIAVIATAHGVHGSVKIKSFMESVKTLCSLNFFKTIDGKELKIKSIKPHKEDIVIASFEDIKNRNMAEELKGTQLFIDRESLPEIEDEETFYHSDLEGLKAHSITGKKIGIINNVLNFGAGDILEIKLKSNELVCAPFNKDAVTTVDMKEGFVIIDVEKAFTADDIKKIKD